MTSPVDTGADVQVEDIRAVMDNRGRIIGLFNMSSLGLRAFSGISVGLVGVHWSLALSALVTLAVAGALLALP